MDNQLIFLHLPKNGGMTFHSILNRFYSKESTYNITTGTKSNNSEYAFVNMTDLERTKINLVKGHLMFGLHQYMNSNTKYVTFLRKPDERIISFYYYVLRKPKNNLYHKVKSDKMSLYDFATRIESKHVNNCQVRWISGIDDKEEYMLEKALENIERHFSFVGITEKFNASLILLKNLYNWPLPYYKVKNKTKNRPTLDAIDKKTIDEINHLNNADNILYKLIDEKISEQIKSTNFMELELLRLSIINRAYSNDFSKKIAGKLKRTFFEQN
ncbi:sulfotransferase family 2 domain-containing protein [Confluentibacter citreus]|uniref:sulfotransferase family 2 domain-containing protein n=1 Tax=Confluentibacter citreus TaxID=2007307 RepID=UPI000C28BD2E|nr:sulfotransferase family 2 domain-containing protein [Confluentibacter citreus]